MDDKEQPTEAQSTPVNGEGAATPDRGADNTPNDNGEQSRHCGDKSQATSDNKGEQSHHCETQSAETTPDGTPQPEQDKGADGGNKDAPQGNKGSDLAAENAKLRDQLLRLAADFDNYRKRMIKEKAEAIEYANENLLGDLLDPLDNLERTLQACGGTGSPVIASTEGEATSKQSAIAEGVKMTLGALVKVLGEKYGLAAFGTAGEKFNPDLHQAIGRTPAGEGEDVAEPTIKEVYQKGYKLHERVIRHAKVMVITPAEKKESSS